MTAFKVLQKKLTPHCRQCLLEDDHSASCGLPTTSICQVAVKKNSNSLKDWGKVLLVTARKLAPTKRNSRQQHQAKTIYQLDELENACRT